jgi:hypothetical protein
VNTKQTAPFIAKLATIAPPLVFFGGLFALAAWLLSGDEKKKPEKPLENATVSRPPLTIPPNSGGNSAQNPRVPLNFAEKATVPAPLPSFQVNSIPTEPGSLAPLPSIIPVLEATSEIPLPVRKKVITRKNMATVFHHGASALTRTAAVAALRNIGFGKTAAYAALSPDGRFSTWLRFSPDGIITWNDSKNS